MIQLFCPSLKEREFICLTATNLFNFLGGNHSFVMLAFRRSLETVRFCWKCRSVIEHNFELWKSQGNLDVTCAPYLARRKPLQRLLADEGVSDRFLGN